MPENVGFWFLVAGLLLAAVGWLWLLVRVFAAGFWWGLGVFLLPPLVIGFVGARFQRARVPLAVLLLGCLVFATPLAVNAYVLRHLDLGPYVRVVEGERHVTLTGWDRDDYSVLLHLPDTVVLQIANADVTDATLDYVVPLKHLEELDLSDSAITDAGLARLVALPKLLKLRLKGTAITNDGLASFLEAKPELIALDVRETAAKPSLLRAWKKERDGRQVLY